MQQIECIACGKGESWPYPVTQHICETCYLRKEEYGGI